MKQNHSSSAQYVSLFPAKVFLFEILLESPEQLFLHLIHAGIMKVEERHFCVCQRPECGMHPG